MSISVQPATIDILEKLYRIEKDCFNKDAYSKEYLSYLLTNSNSVRLVAKIDEEIAGFVIGLVFENAAIPIGHIYTLDVAPKNRRIGVGSRLLKELERVFTLRGVKICFLETPLDDQVARSFYRKNNYTETQLLRDYYARGRHGIRLKKTFQEIG